MTNVVGLDLKTKGELGGDKSHNRILLIQSLRMFSLLGIALTGMTSQFQDPQFLDPRVIYFLGMLFVDFLASSVYLYFFEAFFKRVWISTALLFVLDALFITGLIQVTGMNQSIFLFLYLVNIALCGFVFQRRGAISLALLTSVLFSIVLVMGPTEPGQKMAFILGLNNLAFFAVAVLSGFLSEQLNFMGSEIEALDQEVQSLQNLNEMIVENITSGLMTISSQLKILHLNRAAMDILGESAEASGRELQMVLPDAVRLVEAIQAHPISTGGRYELPFTNPKGEALTLGISISQLIGKSGRVFGFILIFQDLTQIKRLEMAVRRSEKLAAVGALAAGIAHEIRNPLASISGSIQLLQSTHYATGDEDKKLMSIIIREVDRLNRLIGEFLNFVKPETKIESAIYVNDVLSEVIDMVKVNNRLRSDTRQVVKLEAASAILGSFDKLKQVFLNLIINSYQAMDKMDQPEVQVESFETDAKVCVRIRDNGPGMNPKVLARLFEPFHTTKPQGTGLGLATVHKILEAHDAKIFVDSREGQGAEFLIEFIKAPPGAGKPRQTPTTNAESIEKSHEVDTMKERQRGHG